MLSKLLQNQSLFKTLLIIWFLLSFLLFTLPSKTFVNTLNLSDKFVHVALFAIGAVCWGLAEKNALLKILFWLIFYGIAVEFIQEIILPDSFHRGGDVYDAIADSVGVLIGVGIVKLNCISV